MPSLARVKRAWVMGVAPRGDGALDVLHSGEIAAADDGNCVNDVLKVLVATNGAPADLLPGDACSAKSVKSNPIGWSQKAASKKMTYDVTALAGKTVGVSLQWANNATNNAGLGAIVDNEQMVCSLP